MGEAAQILRWIICLSGLVLSLAARDASSKVSLEDEFFEVVGPDHPSVASVGRLGGHVVATSFRLLREPESPLPRKVLVVLQAGEGSGPEEDYEIRLDPRGYVTLVLDWDSSLGLENTIYALSRAFLVQYAYSNFGTGAPPRMRAWPVSTVSSVAYLGLRPAQIATFAEESSAEPGPSAAALLQRELLSVPTDAVDRDGYWLWLLLRREGGMSGSTFQKLMTLGLQGVDVGERLAELVAGPGSDQGAPDLEAWWKAAWADELAVSREPFEGLAPSENWLEALSDFSGLEPEDLGGDVDGADGGALNLRGLWGLREKEELRSVIEARLEILRLGLDRVNPAYFNSAQSLGTLYETVLRGERKFEFIAALTSFLSDFEDTRRLHRRVEAEL